MNLTKHCKLRYVQRIKDICDEKEANLYIAQHEEIIEKEINTLFSYSKLIYTGQIGGDNTTVNFYLHQDICLITDVDNTSIRTLYKIRFPFPQQTNKMVISDLVDEIRTQQERLEYVKENTDNKIQEITNEIELIKEEVKLYQERINRLNNKLGLLKEEKNLLLQECQEIHKEIKLYAIQLFGNTEFKQDAKSL